MRHKQLKKEGLLASKLLDVKTHVSSKESGGMLYKKVLCYAVE